MLRMINVVESKKTHLNVWYVKKDKDDKVKDLFQYMFRRINVVESKKKPKIFDMLRRI